MKLKNKKTGEIIDVFPHKHSLLTQFNSLAELNEEWEDYEASKDYWYLNCDGDVIRAVYKSDDLKRSLIAIGNYFETEEEAEQAVEKLKALKRLKDNGFRFTGINDDEDSQELINQCGILCETESNIYHLAKDEDFLLLFGGEE